MCVCHEQAFFRITFNELRASAIADWNAVSQTERLFELDLSSMLARRQCPVGRQRHNYSRGLVGACVLLCRSLQTPRAVPSARSQPTSSSGPSVRNGARWIPNKWRLIESMIALTDLIYDRIAGEKWRAMNTEQVEAFAERTGEHSREKQQSSTLSICPWLFFVCVGGCFGCRCI